MLSDDQKNKLDRLENKLYSRKAPEIIDKGQTKIEREEEEVSTEWREIGQSKIDTLAAHVSRISDSKHHVVRKIFIASLIFFILSIGTAAFVFLGGSNLVSSKNVDLDVVGPFAVGGGQINSYDITVINENNTDLESVSLIIEYPDGTRNPENLSEDLKRQRFEIGSIGSGKSSSQKIAAVFFGEKESVKSIKLSVEYRVANSSALFFKEKGFDITISSAPVIITPTYPKEVNSNQEINFNIEVASNTNDTLNNFLIEVEYPFGFVPKKYNPEPISGSSSWRFDNLKPGEKKTINLSGNIIGQNNEERVFRIVAGTVSDVDDRKVGVVIADLTESILVKKPFVGLGVSVGGKTEGDYSGRGGEEITVEFTLTNNLPTRLFHNKISVKLSGAALDKNKIIAGQDGFYRSIDNTILWDERSLPELADLSPGESKTLYFRVVPLAYGQIQSGSKPEIQIDIRAEGERVLESGSVENVSSDESRKIVLGTDVNINSRIVRSIGSIENTGPIPPKIEVPTTYGVVWSISNSFNQVSNIEVRAKLPSYVKWTGFYSPQSEVISYNQATNEVVWKAGSVLPNTGLQGIRKEVVFQIEFLPSISQINTIPLIISAPVLTGIDRGTGASVRAVGSEGTTDFSTDPTYRSGDGYVE